MNLVFQLLLCFLLAPSFISLLIDSSISNNLNVSRTWTQWLTTLLSSRVLAILKYAAYKTMLKCLICKSFSLIKHTALQKQARQKAMDQYLYVATTDRQQQQASVAQWIGPVTLKRGAWVRSRVVEEKDASFTGIQNSGFGCRFLPLFISLFFCYLYLLFVLSLFLYLFFLSPFNSLPLI